MATPAMAPTVSACCSRRWACDCDDSAELQDVDAVLITSERGAEALIAARLNDEQRHRVYARIVARLMVGEIRPPIDAKMEYAARPRLVVSPGARRGRAWSMAFPAPSSMAVSN